MFSAWYWGQPLPKDSAQFHVPCGTYEVVAAGVSSKAMGYSFEDLLVAHLPQACAAAVLVILCCPFLCGHCAP